MVVFGELFLLHLFEVEFAGVVLSVSVLGAENEAAFALKTKQANLLAARETEFLISLYLVNSINLVTYLNFWCLFLALLLNRRSAKGCGLFLRGGWGFKFRHWAVLGCLFLSGNFGLFICLLRRSELRDLIYQLLGFRELCLRLLLFLFVVAETL